ncbi:MAG: hypothetical protein ACOCRU_02070, partial [bacterium]
LGGSKEDNLFQISNLEEHLKEMKEVGANYIRCTMSSRDDGDVWPFAKTKEDLYDLNQFNLEYWNKFTRLMELTYNMDIIVQMEIWDRFDFARDPWQDNPFNPLNNINYSIEESLLAEVIETHPSENENRFFFTVPKADNNTLILDYQEKFVDKLLSITFNYPHILYCMDNETCAMEEWGRYWALYIQKRAQEKGIKVHTTEMWDAWNLSDEQHNRTFDHPEIYSYCDISQNNHQKGQQHWDNIQLTRERIKNQKRPLNCVKIYGSDENKFGTAKDAVERFWRNIFGKLASARFHRPQTGLGLSNTSKANIKSMRLILDEVDIFTSEPNNGLLKDRDENEAYCLVNTKKKEAAVFFCNNGNVKIDLSILGTVKFKVKWLDIRNVSWISENITEIRSLKESNLDSEVVLELKLNTPLDEGEQVVIIKAVN